MNKQLAAVGAAVLLGVVGIAALSANPGSIGSGSGEVAIVPLSGGITPSQAGAFAATGITPGGVRDLNDRAMRNDPEAIVYEINSGGGAVVASKEVKREIESVEVPTVCRFRDVSASGGYYMALGCDRIVADTATLTGSIGVRSGYLQYKGLLDRYGVEYVNVSAGEYKEIGSPYQNISAEERRILQRKVEEIHDEFVSTVEEERNLSDSQVREVKTGEPILGERAKKLGLVDETGGRRTAVREAENLAGTNLTVRVVESSSGFSFGSLLGVTSFFSGSTQAPLQAEY